MVSRVIIDTGPLVSFLIHREKYHHWAFKNISEVESPLITNTAVLSECIFLLNKTYNGVDQLIEMIQEEFIEIVNPYPSENIYIHELLLKYKNISASLADCSLIAMHENMPNSKIMTIDSDFLVYRMKNGSAPSILSPA